MLLLVACNYTNELNPITSAVNFTNANGEIISALPLIS